MENVLDSLAVEVIKEVDAISACVLLDMSDTKVIVEVVLRVIYLTCILIAMINILNEIHAFLFPKYQETRPSRLIDLT